MFKSNLKLILWTIIIVLTDQITKLMVSSSMNQGESFRVLGNVLQITYIKNPGMAFGIQIGNKIFFTIFALIASLVILIYLFRLKPENFLARFALASILGGAIGNLIDRFAYGEVIDFIYIKIIRWPVFNVADVAVTIGMIFLIAFVIFDSKNVESHEEQPETS